MEPFGRPRPQEILGELLRFYLSFVSHDARTTISELRQNFRYAMHYGSLAQPFDTMQEVTDNQDTYAE